MTIFITKITTYNNKMTTLITYDAWFAAGLYIDNAALAFNNIVLQAAKIYNIILIYLQLYIYK